MAEAASTWNSTNFYYPWILRKVGAHPRRNAIDVGSGAGALANELAARIPSVIGLESDAKETKAAAKRYSSTPGLRFVHGDLFDAQIDDEPFDVVTCSATMHLLPMDDAFERLRQLTAPGGILLIVGVAKNTTARDWVLDRLDAPLAWFGFRVRPDKAEDALEPEVSFGEVKESARRNLPGRRYRRRMFGRYSIVWIRPLDD